MSEPAGNDLRETTLSTRRIYQGRVVSLRVDEVELPGGRRSTREIVEHPGAVGAVALTDAGEVLLVRQWRHPVGEVVLEIPAGTRDQDETDEQCMSRELAEEVGHSPGRLESLASVYVSPGYSNESIHLFLATELTEAQAPADFDEAIHVIALPLHEALVMCRDGRIRDGKTVAGLLLAAERVAAGGG